MEPIRAKPKCPRIDDMKPVRKKKKKKKTAAMEELPKTIVRRVVKEKLSQCSPDDHDISVNRDSLLAFSESARIFIHYLSATSNDVCKESKRQTIKAEDVLKALEDMEFPELVRPLKASLDEFRRKNAGKKAAASKEKEGKKKRKIEEAPTIEGTDDESKDEVRNDDDKDEDEDEDEDENVPSDD